MTSSGRISRSEYSEFKQECLSCTRIIVGMDKTYHVTFSSWRIYPEGSQARVHVALLKTVCTGESRDPIYGEEIGVTIRLRAHTLIPTSCIILTHNRYCLGVTIISAGMRWRRKHVYTYIRQEIPHCNLHLGVVAPFHAHLFGKSILIYDC